MDSDVLSVYKLNGFALRDVSADALSLLLEEHVVCLHLVHHLSVEQLLLSGDALLVWIISGKTFDVIIRVELAENGFSEEVKD